MRFTPTAVAGVFVIELAPMGDARGSFARVWCAAAFAEAGIDFAPVQANLSSNPHAGTLRGLHYQEPPHAEGKLIHCTRGRIFDVAVDLRPGSPTYLRHAGIELSPDAARLFFVPEGCAHGYLTLEDASDVHYHVSAPYAPAAARGVRWNDPAFGIDWPMAPTLMAERDAGYPDHARPA